MRVQGTDSERRHTISGLVAQLETRLIDSDVISTPTPRSATTSTAPPP